MGRRAGPCAAGAAARKLVEKRDISGDQIRAIERLKDRTGFHILMGCTSDAVTYEASQYGQGLLTYSLLEGMRGAALREDEFVDVSKLFQYAADRVPQLVREVRLGGIQAPIIAAPRGTAFDIGQLTDEDRAAVPLAMVKPLVLKPVLFNPEEVGDPLRLTQLLGKHLRERSTIGRRGVGPFVYVNADELPGAVQPKGAYTVNDSAVAVTLALWRVGEKTTTLQVKGTTDDLPKLASAMVDAVVKALAGERPKAG